MDITLHFVGHADDPIKITDADNPIKIIDLDCQKWNEFLRDNPLRGFLNSNVNLAKDAKLGEAVFDQTSKGFDEILWIHNRKGLVEKIELKNFNWKRPIFEINKDNNALKISVDYPDDLSSVYQE